MSVVRKSKFRHVYADPPKNEDVWSGIRLTNESWDSNYASCNPKYIAVSWFVGGGGAVGILDAKTPSKLQETPLFTGHRGAVLDLDWNPFNDAILATASNDSTVKVWVVPESGPQTTDQSAQDLRAHTRKVGTVRWNPVAENILASSGADYNVIVYDVRGGDARFTVGGHSNLISSCEWNYNGSLLATACKDKKMRLIDPRAGNIVSEHDRSNMQGTKGNRLIWAGKRDFIISCGFGKNNQRQYEIYDSRNFSNPVLQPQKLDNGSGQLMPFYDMDTEIMFLAGKGDGNIRYYEVDFDSGVVVNYIADYSSSTPTAGMAMLAKRGVNVSVNEIVKLYKVTPDSVQPLSFRVPRKSDAFADDIFVDCSSDEPGLGTDAWISGQNANPKTISLAGGYVEKPKQTTTTFTKTESTSENEPTGAALLQAYREQKQRIAYLESELKKLKQ
jgi:WD40 repeat protein